jgi:TonB family protein
MTDERRMPSQDLHDLLDEMSRRTEGSTPPASTDDPWADPWADDEPISIPDATPQHDDQPTVVGHGLASVRLAAPRGSIREIGAPSVPTAAHARAAALLHAPMARRSVPPAASSPPLPGSTSPSSPQTRAMSEGDLRVGRSPLASSPRLSPPPRMPTLTRPVVDRTIAPPPSRMRLALLGALIAGGIGAFLVSKATQYAAEPDTSAASTIAATRAAPTALVGTVVEDPRPSPLPSSGALPAPARRVAEPAAGPATAVPLVATPAKPAPEPRSVRTDARPEASPRHARPLRAAIAKPGPESEPPPDVRSEPRTDERSEAAGRSEAARVESPPEPPARAAEREPAAPPASVARPQPAVPRAGTIDIAATRAAARAQIGPVQQCYERARMDDASLAGTVQARITIDPDGAVANVEIVKSTLGAPPVEACIRQGILRWRLPRPAGGAASLTYPLVFQ